MMWDFAVQLKMCCARIQGRYGRIGAGLGLPGMTQLYQMRP